MVGKDISKPSDLDIKNEKETKLSEINGEISLLNKEDRLYNENLEKLNRKKIFPVFITCERLQVLCFVASLYS